MPTITSRVHPGTVSSVLRLVADWTAGIWDLSSLAFTIPTGLAGRRTTTLSSFPAFGTGYGSRSLSAQGQSRDLQHGSPMLARCGNIALRDIAHVAISPIDPGKPFHGASLSSKHFLEKSGPYISALGARPSNRRWFQEYRRGRRSFANGRAVWRGKPFPGSSSVQGLSLQTLGREGLVKL
jgi:hypothetical protein